MSSLLYQLSYSLINIYYIIRIKDLHFYLLDMSQLCYYYINPHQHKHLLCLCLCLCICIWHQDVSLLLEHKQFFLNCLILVIKCYFLMQLASGITMFCFCTSISLFFICLSSRGNWIPALTMKKLRLNLLTIEPNNL